MINAIDEKIITETANGLKCVDRNQAAGSHNRWNFPARKAIGTYDWFTEQASVHFVAVVGTDHRQPLRKLVTGHEGRKGLNHIWSHRGVLVQREDPLKPLRRGPMNARV